MEGHVLIMSKALCTSGKIHCWKEFTPFGMEGHVLIMSKALCTSGKRFHEVFADMLSIEGFTPC